MQNDINIKNRRASFDYEFLEEYTAGIMLTGTEIKSIRAGKAGLVDSYCYFHNGELWIKGMYVAEYKLGTYYNHIERRERKLLLQKKELVKLERKTKESGLTIVPVRLFLNEKGFAKLRIALARGKKEYRSRGYFSPLERVRLRQGRVRGQTPEGAGGQPLHSGCYLQQGGQRRARSVQLLRLLWDARRHDGCGVALPGRAG